jgi:hypothetical protein
MTLPICGAWEWGWIEGIKKTTTTKRKRNRFTNGIEMTLACYDIEFYFYFLFSSRIRIIYLTYFSYCLDIYKLPCNPQRYTNVEITKRRATGQNLSRRSRLYCLSSSSGRSLSLDLNVSFYTRTTSNWLPLVSALNHLRHGTIFFMIIFVFAFFYF